MASGTAMPGPGREEEAEMKTIRTRILWGVVVAAGLVTFVGLASVPAGAADDAGQTAFLAAKCEMCHAVSTAGIEARTKSESMLGPDLVNLAESRDAKWLVEYLKRETDLDGKEHKKEFKGSDEELQTIVDWLLEQKAE